jgi:diguanylate cyclase (GGDEF)-like protein
MSVTTQEHQLNEDHRDLKLVRAMQFKCVLNRCFKNIVSPGFVPENIAILSSYLAISLIFLLDVITDPAISFHILYVFSITFIALHGSRTSWIVGAVALSILFQCVSPFFIQRHALEFLVCLFSLIAFSNIICALVARQTRAHILEVKRLSTIDPLTNLCNRRGLDKAMENEAVRQRRNDGHFSLVALDLDGFKGLNDSMGHKAGDKALTLFADILRNQIRQTDTIARVGGDEFVVLMPNTEASDCHVLCHLLCHTIRTRLTEAFSYPLSASIGFATSENANGISVDMLSVVDRALYRAKALGKGCVVRGYAEEFIEGESELKH